MDSVDVNGMFDMTKAPNRGSGLLTPDDKMSMSDIVSGMINALTGSNELESGGVTSVLRQLLSELATREEKLDIDKVAKLCGVLNSMIQLSGLKKNAYDVQQLTTGTLGKISDISQDSDINVNEVIASFTEQLELIHHNPEHRAPKFFSTLLSFWYSEMTKIKYDLSVLYSPELKDPVVDFNSPTVLVRLNKIMGHFETIHNLFSATMGKLLTTMSHISRNLS